MPGGRGGRWTSGWRASSGNRRERPSAFARGPRAGNQKIDTKYRYPLSTGSPYARFVMEELTSPAVRTGAEDGHGGEVVRRLAVGLGLTVGFACLELIAGFWTGSLAVAADAAHMLVDSAGLALALGAALLVRRPSSLQRSYGFRRVEVLVVPLHAILMMGVAGYIAYEAFGRLSSPPDVHTAGVLLVGFAGLAMNLVVLRLLSPHAHDNLNVRGARLEVMTDAAGSVAVVLSAIGIWATGFGQIDPIVGLIVAAVIVPRAAALLWSAVKILLEATPDNVDIEEFLGEAALVPGVQRLHDLHIWSLAPSFRAMSAHVELGRTSGWEDALAGVARLARQRYGITHITLQPETQSLQRAMECCDGPMARLPAAAEVQEESD